VFYGASLLVTMKRAVLATAIIVTFFLMAPLAQFGAVKANPVIFGPTSPGIYVYSPTPEQVYWDPNVEISFEIVLDKDLAQIDSFFYTLDNKANSPLTFSRNTRDHFFKINGNNVTYTVNKITVHKTLVNLTDGTHRIAVFASYSDGSIKSILYRRITVDTTLPNPYSPFTPTIISPVNQTTYNITEVPLTYTIEKEILWSYYSLDSYDDWRYFEGNITLSSLSEGKQWLTLSVITTTGPGFEQPYSKHQTIIFYVDTMAPKVGNLSVNNTGSGDRLLSFTVDEEATWIGYSLDNQANVTIAGDTFLKDLSVGSHNVTVYAEDTIGHMGASETLYFTVDEKPFPTLLVASASVATIAVFAVFLLMRKHKH